MSRFTNLFDARYYAHHCGNPYQRSAEWLDFFNNVAARIIADFNPTTVLDAGCAWGFLVEALRRQGVQAFGVDISEYAIEQVHPDVRPYCWVGSVTAPFPQHYDLIVSIEVLEHMPHSDSEAAVANFCRHSKDVLFSSSPFDYKEETHLNVQPPDYWTGLFARQGFYHDVEFDAMFITPWAMRFRQTAEPVARTLAAYERRLWQLTQENLAGREHNLELRDQLFAAEEAAQTARQQAEIWEARWHDLEATRTWRLLQWLQRWPAKLFPPRRQG